VTGAVHKMSTLIPGPTRTRTTKHCNPPASSARVSKSGENGYLLITSCNPVGQTDENIKYLFDRVDGLEDSSKKVFQFRTVDSKGTAFEYWIAGWSVSKSPIVAKA
jgi:hypothetical protein